MPNNIENSEAGGVGSKLPQGSDVEILLKCMDSAWQDHFQTRTQTWKTLEIEAALAAGLIGIDWQLRSTIATAIAAILLIIAAFFGTRITRHHRYVERGKLSTILKIETIFELKERYKLFDDVELPKINRWSDVINPWAETNTSLFILRMHYILMVFGIVYLICTVSRALCLLR
jgi:hypothetical protein